MVIEVAHSQGGRKLRTLAEEYILGSDLEIRVAVGVDIEYSKSRRITFGPSILRYLAAIQIRVVFVFEWILESALEKMC